MPGGRVGVRTIAPLLAAAVLTVVAVMTAREAGCDDPGRYELGPRGYELIGGCVAPGDLVVPQPAPTKPAEQVGGPARD